jgi:predicted dehydrogenase
MTLHIPSRRDFLATTGAAAAAMTATAAQPKRSPNERINVAVIGVDGKGASNVEGVAAENIVAICDIDPKRAGRTRERFPKATFDTDFRKTLDRKGIDAVVVSTPDHIHAFATIAALERGFHVYCEKPLAHSVAETRAVIAAAAKSKAVTQMGTQIHAGDNYRRVVELVRSGAVGTVTKVQVWCNRRPDPMKKKPALGPTPANAIDYDLWLGPVPGEPFYADGPSKNAWPVFDWRWWWEFGGGVLADMACHYTDLPFWALELGSPTSVKAHGEVLYKADNSVPSVMKVDYTFPSKGDRPAVALTWYHGVDGPSLDGKARFPTFPSGVLFEGDKGQLVADYSHYRLLPESQYAGFTPPAATIPRSIGHHREWLEAIRGNGTVTCPFAYSGRLTEAVLLGNVSYRAGEAITWDAEAGKTGSPKADAFLGREYRKGWSL